LRSRSLKPTRHPGIEEDVEVSALVPSGPADAEGRLHGDVHVVLPHDAVCRGSDAHGDRGAGGVHDAAFPGALALLGGEDGDVGALAVLRAGAWGAMADSCKKVKNRGVKLSFTVGHISITAAF